MLWVIFLGLFLVCIGMSAVFAVYLCLLWHAALRGPPAAAAAGEGAPAPAQGGGEKGLTAAEIQRLGGEKVAGGEEGEVAECAVCLDGIEAGQEERVLPGCRHAFHRPCADRWLAARPHCPLCRNNLQPPPPTPPPSPAELGDEAV